MAINQNHTFDDLDGVKCAIVEKNCKPERVEFLKKVLEYNRYKVVVAKSPPPKAPPPPPATATTAIPAAATAPATPPPPPPDIYTVGVTDVSFNATNAIFGRLLYTPDGHVVTLAYWHQKEKIAKDEIPYFENKSPS